MGPNLQNIIRQIRQCYDMRKVYDKRKIKQDLQKIVRQSYHISYNKMYDSSLAVVRQHQARMQ